MCIVIELLLVSKLPRKYFDFISAPGNRNIELLSVRNLRIDIPIYSVIWKMETLILCYFSAFQMSSESCGISGLLKILFGICSQH